MKPLVQVAVAELEFEPGTPYFTSSPLSTKSLYTTLFPKQSFPCSLPASLGFKADIEGGGGGGEWQERERS